MNIDETDFSSFTMAQQIRHFEVEGYVVLPDVLDADLIAKLKAELRGRSYEAKNRNSEYQTTGAIQPQWHSRATAELIGHPPTIEFLTELMGPDIVFTRGFLSAHASRFTWDLGAHRRSTPRLIDLRLRRQFPTVAADSLLP